MNEFEKKLMLTEAEYYRILTLFEELSTPMTQVNYYYDTDDLSMHQQNVTCRIRQKGNKNKATMKVHIPNSDRSVEIHMGHPESLKENVFTAMGLKLQGKLITERTLLKKTDEYEIVLDKNKYLESTDYELEIEYYRTSKYQVEVLLQSIKDKLCPEIHSDPSQENSFTGETKAQRFFTKLKNNFIYDSCCLLFKV